MEENEKTRKELIEDIMDKVGAKMTFDEICLMDEIDYKFTKLENLERPETLYYGIEELQNFKDALKTTQEQTRTRNTSIEIFSEDSYANNFEIKINPTTAGFLCELFRNFGRNQILNKK